MTKKDFGQMHLEDHKKVLLDIMDSIHSFCVENNLKYSLMYGSLLGAVRHRGFIPWDDDIDIAMPRKDYEIFIKGFQFCKTKYRIINHESNKNFYLPFTKVYDPDTVLIENIWRPVSIGANVDVFPIDSCGNTLEECVKNEKKSSKYRYLNMLQMTKISKDRFFLKNIALLFVRLLPRKLLVKKIISISKSFQQNARFSGVLVLMTYKNKEFLETDKINDVIEMTFEGHTYFGFKNYEYVLSNLYGDFMKLPPEEKRISHHDYSLTWK